MINDTCSVDKLLDYPAISQPYFQHNFYVLPPSEVGKNLCHLLPSDRSDQ